MAHYTIVKTTMFNGVPHPSICIRREGGDMEMIREFTFEDYRNRMG
jgi:carboxynorspermidine decarboxylase